MRLMPREVYTVLRQNGDLLTVEPGAMGPDSIRFGDVTWSLDLLASIGDLGFQTPEGEAVRVVTKGGRRVFERVVL